MLTIAQNMVICTHINEQETHMFTNLTPHEINIFLDGNMISIPPSGTIARVDSVDTVIGNVDGIPVVRSTMGDVTGLPDNEDPIIVSLMVLDALQGKRKNVYAPDSGSTCIRNEKGHIVAVTRLKTI